MSYNDMVEVDRKENAMTFAEFKKNAKEFYDEYDEEIWMVGIGVTYLALAAICGYQFGKIVGYAKGSADGCMACEALVKHMEPEAYARIIAKAEEFNGIANAVNKAVA